MRHVCCFFLFLSLFFFWGCGYQMVGKSSHLPPDLHSIAIPTFTNQTFEPGIEVPLTQAFLKEFIGDKRVKVVGKTEADCILEGVVKDFRIFSVSYDRSGYVLEYQAHVALAFALKKRTGEVIWAEPNFSETGWFRATSGGLVQDVHKQAALQEIGRLAAGRIRNRFYYNF